MCLGGRCHPGVPSVRGQSGGAASGRVPAGLTPGRRRLRAEAYVPPQVFYNGKVDYFDQQRLGGLLSHLRKTLKGACGQGGAGRGWVDRELAPRCVPCCLCPLEGARAPACGRERLLCPLASCLGSSCPFPGAPAPPPGGPLGALQ